MSPSPGSLPSPFHLQWIPLLCFLLAFFLPSLRAAGPPPRLKVLTTFAPLHSWALNVALPDASVELLLPGDVGPHDFQLRPQDLRRIRQADLIIANGLGMEGWLDKAIRNNAKGSEARVVRTSDGLKSGLIFHLPVLSLDPGGAKPGRHAHAHDHDHEAAGESPNPHVWLDPIFACHGVSNIVRALVQADPTHAPAYQERGQAYIARLETLDREIRAAVEALPHKAIVTFHDAFPYFCRRYQLELVGVIEEAPSVEPSPRYLASLAMAIRVRGVKGIFTEPQFNPRLVKQISQDLGIRFAELDVLETGHATPGFYEEGLRRNLKSLQSILR